MTKGREGERIWRENGPRLSGEKESERTGGAS